MVLYDYIYIHRYMHTYVYIYIYIYTVYPMSPPALPDLAAGTGVERAP